MARLVSKIFFNLFAKEWPSEKNRDLFFLSLLVFMTAILVFAFCWQPGFLDGDSIGYAQVAKLAADSNQWLALEDSSWGGPYYYHFPLVIWVTAIIFNIFGVNVVSASLFSLFSCLGAVISLFYFGKLIKNNWVGFFAGICFLLISYTPRLAQQCRMDMPLTFFIILSLYFFVIAIRGRKGFYLLFGLFSSLAIMTKDVNGLAPLGIAFSYLLLTRRFKTFVSPHFLAGAVLSFIPVLVWIWLEHYLYGQTLFSNWFRWNFLNLLRHKGLHAPFYYYPLEILKRYFYFVPFFVYGGYLAVREALKRESDRPLLILTWACFIPLAFSFGSRKLHYFIYSMYPAAALLAGMAVDNLCQEKIKLRILRIFIVALIVLGLLRLCIPLRLGKTYFTDTVFVASPIDSILKQETQPYEFFTFVQHDGALIMYCRQLEGTIALKNYEALVLELAKERKDKKRFLLLKQEDFDTLELSIRNKWHVLFRLEKKVLITDRL